MYIHIFTMYMAFIRLSLTYANAHVQVTCTHGLLTSAWAFRSVVACARACACTVWRVCECVCLCACARVCVHVCV